MDANTSSNKKLIPPQYETFSQLEAEFFGAIEEYAINYHDAEDSITKINDRRSSNGKQG